MHSISSEKISEVDLGSQIIEPYSNTGWTMVVFKDKMVLGEQVL